MSLGSSSKLEHLPCCPTHWQRCPRSNVQNTNSKSNTFVDLYWICMISRTCMLISLLSLRTLPRRPRAAVGTSLNRSAASAMGTASAFSCMPAPTISSISAWASSTLRSELGAVVVIPRVFASNFFAEICSNDCRQWRISLAQRAIPFYPGFSFLALWRSNLDRKENPG